MTGCSIKGSRYMSQEVRKLNATEQSLIGFEETNIYETERTTWPGAIGGL